MVRFLLLMVLALTSAHAGDALRSVQIATLDGQTHHFTVRIADTPAAQQQGLMHVAHLPARTGMIFPMAPPRIASFWMRNTLIPLDMVFILPGGIIGQVVTRMDTRSDAQTTSIAKVSGVLELNAGETARLNIGVGDRLTMQGYAF